MPVFEYEAIDSGGRPSKGILTADSMPSALYALKQRQLYVKSIQPARADASPQGESGTGRTARWRDWFSGVSRAQVTTCTQVLATLLEAGLPLDKSLQGLIEHMPHPAAQRVFSHILERVKEGWDLSTALAEHPGVFPDTYIHMVKAGESTGTLQIVMANLASYLERQQALKKKLQAAMVYPAFILVFGVLVIGVLLIYVIPEVTRIFLDLNRELPLPTTILIAMTDFLRAWWFWMLAGAGAMTLVGMRLLRLPAVAKTVDKILLRLPVFGPILRDAALARMTRALGTCLKQGVTLLDSVDIAAAVTGNSVFTDAMAEVREKARQGAGLSEPMRAAGVFPPMLMQLTAAGEQGGKLDAMLMTLARMLETDVSNRIAAASSIVEPALILTLGAVVAFMVIAVMLPIFEMSTLIG
uniref:General secretion pathway protein F n=1 Tax=Fundidesulfovibrio putealis TaxID=270496 RepID=A0A7C3W8L6_9BACT